MATLLFSAVGTAFGGPLGGAIGALVGQQFDSAVFGGTREGPRLTELAVTTSSYGAAIPRHFGTMRVAGQIIWATDLVEHSSKQSNGKGKPSTITYTYTASFAVALSSRPVLSVGRIWADGNLLRGAGGDLKVGGTFRLYRGLGDQAADPLIAAAEGAAQCPAHRGLAYAVFEDLQLGDYGNRIPALTFEVIADDGTLSLADVIGPTLVRYDAAVPLVEISGMTSEGPLKDVLSALDPLFPVDLDACGSDLVFRPDRLQAGALALPEAATASGNGDFGGNAGFAAQRTGPTPQPVQILRYYDVGRDYQPGSQRASGRPVAGQPSTIDLPAAMTAIAARAVVERAAKRLEWSRQSLSWRVTELDPAVRPGAVVTVQDQPGLWRVRDWEWREHGVDLTLARLAPDLTGLALSADAGRASQALDLPIGQTDLVVYELPWDGNSATSVPLIIAATSSANPAWAGASLSVDQGDGALLPLGSTGRARAIIGSASTVLAPASPLLFDRANTVTVALAGADFALTDATMRQLAMGANRALIGTEIIQFASAAPLGGGLWRLSGLWRGRGGTESATVTHAVGEPFALLDGSGTVLDPTAIGAVPGTVIAAIGLGDGSEVTGPILLRGIGARPLSPVHGKALKAANGSVLLTWIRRARGAWNWVDAADTPLGEQAEVYDIVFGPALTPLARWTTNQPVLAIAATDLTALLALAPAGPFSISQRGDFASSEPLIVPMP